MIIGSAARPLIGWLSAGGVVVIWAGWVVISRLGVTQSLTPYDMMALRFGVASVAVAPFVWRYWPRELHWWKVAVIACGQGTPYLLLSFTGLQYAPASHAGVIINGTLPVITAALAWLWMKQHPALQQGIGTLIILAGCALIALDQNSATVSGSLWSGHIMFLGAAFFVAVNMIGTRMWGITPLQAMVCIPTLNLLWFGPWYVWLAPKSIMEAPWPDIVLQGAYQGLGPSVLAVLLITTAVRSVGPSSTAAAMALVPAAVTLLAIPVLGEWPSGWAWSGLAVTSLGMVLASGWRLGMASYPGVLSPTECFAALRSGADGLKFFPSMVIGPQGVSALLAVLPPGTPTYAVGGVDQNNFDEWARAGISGFGVGSALYRPGYTAQQVSDHAQAMVAAYDRCLG